MARVSNFFINIFSGFIFIIFLLLVLTLYTSFRVMKNNYNDIIKGELEKINLALEEKAIEYFDSDSIDSFIKEAGKKLGVRITLIDTLGIVRADSEHNPKTMENHRHRFEIDYAIMHQEIGSSVRYSNTLKKEMLYVAQALVRESEVIGVIRSSMFLKNINIYINDLRNKLIKASYLVFFISLVVAIVISRSISNPVSHLKNAALSVSKGDFATKVEIINQGDFKTLADTFNEMTSRIQELFGKVKDEKETLNCLLESIKEGIVVLDKGGNIILANPEMARIAGQEMVGKHYSEIFHDKFFGILIDKVKKNENVSMETIHWRDMDFIFSLSQIESRGDIIFSLKNITEMKQLEQIKKDFVSNVSHELRTPLTAIKGFVETLQEEETDETKKHYFEILEKHTDRLINIVKDLLALSSLESRKSKLDIEKVNLENLINDVQKVVELKIREKNLYFEKSLDPDALEIDGDRFKLEQLLINLIDNSAKYTDLGGISVSTEKMKDKIQISIKDTGIGIPEKHLHRVFERFYVVDKSRSRKMGGTGLGLSIVKHIVMQHHGEITLKSEKNEGTEFIIELPVLQPVS
ncbi:MAG: HAMP domain-containing protein [Candidatus Marinimicrobia bacterium]|nr:HAMP domain-containing protein [Candidatus Neomarinimicrobiota bacterium]